MTLRQHLQTHLQAIYDEHECLTPKLVVDMARDPAHALHERYFGMPDSEAAGKWRLSRAHQDIQSIKVVYRKATTQEEVEIRGWVAVKQERDLDEEVDDPVPAYIYKPVEEVANDEFLSELTLREMDRRWRELKRDYGHMQEFIDMVRGDLGETAA